MTFHIWNLCRNRGNSARLLLTEKLSLRLRILNVDVEWHGWEEIMKRNRIKLFRRGATQAFGEVALDAGLGAVCGVLYGASFGSFGLMIHGDFSQMLPNVGYWALCIAVVVALVSSLSELLKFVASSHEASAAIESFGIELRAREGRTPSRPSPRQEKSVSIASV
jgi:hypothetical protein